MSLPWTPARELGRIRFRRALALMVMTLVLPGSAQLVAGRKEVGRVAMRIWFGLILTGLFLLLVGWCRTASSSGSSPTRSCSGWSDWC